jgi:hypothetical protein
VTAAGRDPRGRALVLLAVAAGLGLRLWEAFESSLWLDELHSLAHASPKDLAGVFEHVHWDFHVPLFFAALHSVWRSMSPEALRIIPVVSNMLVLVPLLFLARRSRLGASAPALAAGLFATLPFQIQYAVELRPYAWLMLASAVACWAAFTDAGSKRTRFLVFAAAVAFGMWSHHLMAFTVLLAGATRVLFLLPPLRDARFRSGGPQLLPQRAPRVGDPLLGLGWLILAGAIGAATLLPWVLKYMFWVFDDPKDLVPREQQVVTGLNVRDLVEAPLKTLVPTIHALGTPWQHLALAGTVLLALGIAAGSFAWFARAVKRDLPAADRAVAMTVTFAVLSLLVLVMSIWGWARVSIRYVCIAAWIWPLVICELVAAARTPAIRAGIAALALGGATVAGIAHAGGTSHEDVRAAVAMARTVGQELLARDPGRPPIYTALLHQPPRFEHCTPYLAYARDLPCVELKRQVYAGPQPPLLPAPGDPGFDRPVVVVTRRWLDLDTPAVMERARREGGQDVLRLREGRRVTRKIPIDETMSVWVFEPGS